jgi:secreted trypsin-like serine protease
LAFENWQFQARIVGGSQVPRAKYPYAQVSIQDLTGTHQCGGSVVAPDVILSAGHCAPVAFRVVVGMYDLSDTSDETVERFGVEGILRHPNYDDFSLEYDVLLLKLDGNISSVDPVKVNGDSNVPTSSENLTVVGWGATSESMSDGLLSDVMMEVEVAYIENSRCTEIQDELGQTLDSYVFDNMLCAGGNGKDACYGDSGGPLLKVVADETSEPVQVGITSWGTSCESLHPGVYHRISYTYQWIRNNVCQLSKAPPDYLVCNTDAPMTSPAPSEVSTQGPTQGATLAPTIVARDGTAQDVRDVAPAADSSKASESVPIARFSSLALILAILGIFV